jgi:nucleoside-diphosphate kinase
MERSLIILKPDAVQRGLVGELTTRLERRGLKIVGMRLLVATPELAHRHYAEHVDRPFFPGLIEYITSGPIVVMALEGPGAIELIRATVGTTKPAEAAPGTIRADYGLMIGRNLIHASANAADADKELGIWFEDGLLDYSRDIDRWILE